MATQPAPAKSLHVVIFPFMAQGHTLPLLDLSKTLASRGLHVTIITTPSNSPSILKYISQHKHAIQLEEFPFPVVDSLPKGCENTAQLPSMELFLSFLSATAKLQEPFEEFLQWMIDSEQRPICVISDFFLGWTLSSCRKLGIPRFVSHGMSVLAMAISKYVWKHKLHRSVASDSETIHLPEASLPFNLMKSDLQENFRFLDDNSPHALALAEAGETDTDSDGIVVNSFQELEGTHVSFCESFYRHGVKAYLVGPLFLIDSVVQEPPNEKNSSSATCIHWLSNREARSVLYVSFGTQANLSNVHLDEIASGLDISGVSFVWVIRSSTWTPHEGFVEKVEGRGLIMRDWVEQKRILAQPSICGFLSHCGWNSVLESLSAGVPLLAMPMNAEQPLNAKFIVDGLGAGIRVPMGPTSGWGVLDVNKDGINTSVSELVRGEKGKMARKRAEELGIAARKAVVEGGSSYVTLSELIESLDHT